MPAQPDVLLPKHITDSCYASLTQTYADLFQLIPKSNLKPSLMRQSISSKGHQRSSGRLFSIGSSRGSANLSKSKKVVSPIKSDTNKQSITTELNKGTKWHEPLTETTVTETRIDFNTRF